MTVLPTSPLADATLPSRTLRSFCRAWSGADRVHKQSSVQGFLPDIFLWVVYELELRIVHWGVDYCLMRAKSDHALTK